jgi:triphosphoribosyl-dephospho-CoA synthase
MAAAAARLSAHGHHDMSLGPPLHAPRLAGAAVRALYLELALEPKPGLVSLRDNGSHRDMNAATFMRSLFSLRHYFAHVARAGAREAPFCELEALGRQAEARMLAATRGINTHRGAVFCLGLLCAAAGRQHTLREPATAAALQGRLRSSWGPALHERAARARARAPRSHGEQAARRHALRSAGDEAAQAFPTLFGITWPALQGALQKGWSPRSARVQALFETMAVLDDTNLVHRGGMPGLLFARRAAAAFLAAGGAGRPGWIDHARSVHQAFVARNLSPGGSADLLGAACWIALVCQDPPGTPAARPHLATAAPQ